MNSHQKTRRRLRSGAMLVVVCVMLTVFLAMAAISVDLAYMELTQAELRAASDAAAKAAARELSLSDGDKAKAIAVGKAIASQNTVGGRPLILLDEDFEFGIASQDTDGRLRFSPQTQEVSAVRVSASQANNQLYFANSLGLNSFQLDLASTATYPEHNIVLAIDRSHSMAFDESGEDWKYPIGIPIGDTDGDGMIDFADDALLSPPHPIHSRWASLEVAIDRFLHVFSKAVKPPRVALVTWASYLGPGTYETYLTGLQFPAIVRDVSMTDNYASIQQSILQRGDLYMLGGTNTAAGIDEAVAILQSNQRAAKKSVVLMTDGMENEGRGALAAARDARQAGVVVHVITFVGGDQSAMAAVANETGGLHVHASNRAELVKAFEDLAKLVPVSLIE